MAVHLKMDFRVLELPSNINILQCDRGREGCLYEVEYNNKIAGALVEAIHHMRRHLCEAPVIPSKPKSAGRVLPLFAKQIPIVSNG